MENEAVKVLKLVLISFRVFSGISFVQIKTASLLFTVSSEAPEFMRHYSQKLFVEESEIFRNTITTFKASIRVLCNVHIWQYQSL